MKVASRTGKESFLFPASRLILSIAEVLEKKGFVESISKKGKKGRYLDVKLSYDGKQPRVSGIKRVSHLSKRIYQKTKDLRPVRSGLGVAILSTPRGILSDNDAKAANVGGEVLFEIW